MTRRKCCADICRLDGSKCRISATMAALTATKCALGCTFAHDNCNFEVSMAAEPTTAIARRRRPRGQHPKRVDSGQELVPKPLPQYLEAHEVQAIIRAADDPRARLLMTEQWRAGLRVSEALALEVADLSLDAELPTIRVRSGKGRKSRIVPGASGAASCVLDGAGVWQRL